ncbi:MAG: ATP-binding protein [Prevotellaceae bacterium]|jgi:predicted AAA+ superfamily ATPase|nr:ATP-binding protein [Prevotellaceae bacterium]
MSKQYISRELHVEMERLKTHFPVIVLTGPRQSGKTTLAKNLFPNYKYVDLTRATERNIIETSPEDYLRQYAHGIIIDEAQNWPEIFPYVKIVADDLPESNIILTGSNNFSLMEKVTESLAGRAATLALLPLSLHELGDEVAKLPTDTLLFNGGYPVVWAKNTPAADASRHYYNLYIERDVRKLLNVKDLSKFQIFIRLCAGRVGTEFNAQSLSNEIGVSHHTIYHWLSILEASYLVFRLPPFYQNIGKRLVKSPKIFFYDTAIICFLLGIETIDQLKTHPQRGAIFENYVILEFLKNRYNSGKSDNLFFYRDQSQREVDIVQQFGNTYNVYEIKSSVAFHSDFTTNMNYLKKLLGDTIQKRQVIYDGATDLEISENGIVNFRNIVF